MTAVLEGIRILEVAQWAFVPSAAAVLGSWGAEVIKVEHPRHGDPVRSLVSGAIPAEAVGKPLMHEVVGHSKRSIGIDVNSADGLEVLLRLVDGCDVFLTNFLPEARQRIGIDVEDIKARNPRAIYARGSALGPRGPESDRGGFDMVSHWYRGSIAQAVTPAGLAHPLRMPAPGFGDLPSGLMLAGGICAALAYRERTGEAVVVDMSLLGGAIWSMQSLIVGAGVVGTDDLGWPPSADHPQNPLANTYQTSDGRFIAINMLESQRHWPGVCHVLGRDDLVEDARFRDAEARKQNAVDCVTELAGEFARHPLAHWTAVLATQDGPWDVVRSPLEVHDDPQAWENGYLQEVEQNHQGSIALVTSPVQFDEQPAAIRPSEEAGASTELILLDLGYTWDEITQLKATGAIS